MRTSDVASTPQDTLSVSGVKGVGGVGPLFCCPDCAYKTTSLRKLGRHRSVNHAGVKYRCEHCDFVTGYQSNYYRHRKQVHNGGMSQSALQAVATNSTPTIQSQMQAAKNHVTPNSFRGASLPTTPNFAMSEEQQRLLAAAIMASTATPFRCDRCPFQANTGDQLAAHISLLHGADGQRTCGECGVTVATKSQWQEHFRTYHGQRNQSIFSKADYTNLFNSLANNGAAALTAAHLIMAAAANGSGGAGYDLNLLASAAALTSTNGLANQHPQQQGVRIAEQAKILESTASAKDCDADKNCQRYYACVYDCDFAARSSREYLHHLRDDHGERFAIFYCDQCDEYATKFVARLRRHKALVHDGEKSISTPDAEEQGKSEGNGFLKSNGSSHDQKTNDGSGLENDDEEEIGDRKLSIVVDHHPDTKNGSEETTGNGTNDGIGEEMDGVFRCAHCPYATNELSRFKKHAKCHETTADTRCQFCNFRTVYSWNLDRHVRCHRQTGKFTCRRCSFSQNTRQSMQFHLQHHHDDVSFATIETQTDDSENWIPNVEVGFEPFIFEKHAVHVNANADAEMEKGNADSAEEEANDGELDESPSANTNGSPFDQSQCSENGRHSTPTPPALLINGASAGASAILQQNRRHQVFHRRLQFKRKQHQFQGPGINAEARRMRKFLSEQEAIEIPSDIIGNEFDNDPDIRNRHCSVCGYQGKWISEMIRHKRVHTNERPFKCKYCSRTSKWKADLIRHVAKVHGYRVVSKYSRSKTFDDEDKTALRALKEAVQCSTPPAFSGSVKSKSTSASSPAVGKQEISSPNMEEAEFDEMDGLYDGEEGLDLSMDGRKAGTDRWPAREVLDGQDQEAMEEEDSNQQKTSETTLPLAQLGSEKQQLSAEAAALMFRQLCGGIQVNDNHSNGSSSPGSSVLSSNTIPVTKELRDIIGSKQLTGALEKYVMIKQAEGGEPILKCRVCPYETRDLHTFRAHTQKHENKKPYLCSTCGYRSNWSSDVHKHIRLKKTGHETAYVIKLNESDLPAMATGQFGELASPIVVGRSSSNSDCSSSEFVNSGEGPNRNAILNTPSPAIDGRNVGQVTWRCLKCDLEDDSRSVIVEHLHRIHQTPPFACRHCDFTSLHRKTCIYHAQSQHNSRDSNILENLTCEYRMRTAKTPVDNPNGDRQNFIPPPNAVVGEDKKMQPFKRMKEESPAARVPETNFGSNANTESQKINQANESNAMGLDQMTAAMMAANAAAAFASTFSGNGQTKSVEWLQLAQLCFLGGFPMNTGSMFTSDGTRQEEKGESTSTSSPKAYPCDKCPFVGRTESDFFIHERGHRAPSKGLMCYKCVFCEWYAPKKAAIFDHMKLHTDQPAKYQAEVERNMITPLSRKRAADDSAESAAANALLGLAKAEKVYKADSKNGKLDSADIGKDEGDHKRPKSDISVPSNQRNVFLGRSDVDEVMSDFNAIIHAADQDMEGEFQFRNSTNGNGQSANGKSIEAVAIGMKSGKLCAASTLEKLYIQKMKSGASLSLEHGSDNLESSGGIEPVHPDIRTLDREAYIHAGEDAFDSISRLGEVTKGEIQKVTAVVDGQVRKMWQCRHCPHMSKRRANVRMHEKKHFKSSAIGVFKCPKCNYRGDKRSLHVHYRVHMSAENGGSATMPELFQCTNCPAIFQSQEDLALHLINHNSGSSNAYRCARCSYAVSSSSALQKHARVHDRQIFASIDSAAAATADAKRQVFSNRRYANSAAIANVIVQHEEISSYSANGEGRNETALNLVTRHENGSKVDTTSVKSTPSPTLVESGSASVFAASLLHPSMKPKKYLCTRCPAKFADRTQLNRHVQFHGVKLKFKCYICDYSVPFPINLTKHMKSHHNVDIADISAAVSVSDNENESEMAASAGETGDLDEGSASSDYEEDSEDRDQDKVLDQGGFESGSIVASPPDGSLKIKINLGALKPSSSVA